MTRGVPGGAARVGHAPGALLLLSPYLSVDSKSTSVQKTGQLTPVDRSIDAQHPNTILIERKGGGRSRTPSVQRDTSGFRVLNGPKALDNSMFSGRLNYFFQHYGYPGVLV